MIHPDPSCGSDTRADAATVRVTRVWILRKKKSVFVDSPHPISPPAVRSSTLNRLILSLSWRQTHTQNVRMYNPKTQKYARNIQGYGSDLPALRCHTLFLSQHFPVGLYYEYYYTFGISIFSNRHVFFVALIRCNMNALKECATVQVPVYSVRCL